MTIILTVSSLEKKYSNIQVIDKISFIVKKGEFISFLGPNGCGKTTLLNILSGIDTNYTGTVTFNQKELKQGFIFQNPNDSLLPWENIINNLRLDNRGIGSYKIKEMLEELSLINFKNKFPYQLSGGMKQLLAIARAFIFECNLLFLDEPFSSLDYNMAQVAREKLGKLWQREKPTVFFVSHSIEETILLSDKIILLSKRPAKIKRIMEINLPWPRDNLVLTSERFLDYKKEILAEMENEILPA